jgi:hypothetical protein
MDLREEFASFLVRLRTANAFQFQSHFHVLLRCKGGEEIEGLEDETDVAQPHLWQIALFQVRNLGARDLDTTRTTAQNASHDGEQRRLAASRRTHQEQHFAPVDIEIHSIKGSDSDPAFRVGFGDTANSNCSFHVRSFSAGETALIAENHRRIELGHLVD